MEHNVFSGRYIDRNAELRSQPEELDAIMALAATRFVPVWQEQCLIDADRISWLSRDEVAPYLQKTDRSTYLGTVDGSHLFCVAIEGLDPPSFRTNGEFVGLREISSQLPGDDAALLAFAKAMVAWQNNHRHCGVCGCANRLLEAGFVMECADPECGHRSFPRLDPAIIVLVEHGDKCLLGRQKSWPENRFSTIAGFVEPGESLEDALRREVEEETNVRVGGCRYLGSQPWPFPAALMIGFHARAETTSIVCNDGELAEARWVSRPEIVAREVLLPPTMSIAFRLIEAWFDRYDGPSLATLNIPSTHIMIPRPLDRS